MFFFVGVMFFLSKSLFQIVEFSDEHRFATSIGAVNVACERWFRNAIEVLLKDEWVLFFEDFKNAKVTFHPKRFF